MKIIRPVSVTDTGSFTRATTATYIDSAGAIQTAAINAPRFNYDPSDLASGPSLLIEAAATNLVLNSAALVTQGVTTTAANYTLSFYGTGTVTLSGAATGFLAGSGTGRSSLTFAATAGTVTLTVVGTCTQAQVELGSVATSYIPTVGSTVTRAADVNTAMMLSNVPETDYAVWNGSTMYITGNYVLDLATHKVYLSSTGIQETVTMTIASPGVITFSSGIPPAANTPIKFSTTGALPTGIVAGTVYYVKTVTLATCTISATVGGAAINTSGSQSGVHTATASTNLNKAVSDTTQWIDAGNDNRWRMFDQSITSQTSQATSITVAITPGARFDSIVGLNCAASAVTIKVVDPTYGLVYSETQSLVSDSGIDDWFDYYYEPVINFNEFITTSIPVGYSSATVTVSITAAAPAIGGLVIGLSKEVGDTEANARVGVVDYSAKTKDQFGNYTVVQRAFSKRADFTIKVPTASVDMLQSLLAGYRAIPVVYVGSNVTADQQYRSTIIYGFYKDFSIDISYPPLSTCTLQVEGLT